MLLLRLTDDPGKRGSYMKLIHQTNSDQVKFSQIDDDHDSFQLPPRIRKHRVRYRFCKEFYILPKIPSYILLVFLGEEIDVPIALCLIHFIGGMRAL